MLLTYICGSSAIRTCPALSSQSLRTRISVRLWCQLSRRQADPSGTVTIQALRPQSSSVLRALLGTVGSTEASFQLAQSYNQQDTQARACDRLDMRPLMERLHQRDARRPIFTAGPLPTSSHIRSDRQRVPAGSPTSRVRWSRCEEVTIITWDNDSGI